jgi:Domain of unknown function (DUF3854)
VSAAALPRPATMPAISVHTGQHKLADDHRRHLYTSGLSDREIDAAGCFTVNHPRFGRCLVFLMHGFRRRNGTLEPLGVEALYRPDTPKLELRDDGTWRPRKYEREWGSRSTLFCQPDDLALLADRTIPIYVVEGVKKMLKLRAELRRAGRPGVVIHANGIWTNQRKSADGEYRLYDDWFEFPLRGRRIILVPDSDAEPGGTTEQAWKVIAQLLDEAGAVVSRTHLANAPNGDKVGPDDFFVAHGTLDQLLATVTDYGAWLAPLNPDGDVVAGAAYRAVCTERDDLKARHALDRALLGNRNLKAPQKVVALLTLDAMGYSPVQADRAPQTITLDSIAARGMPKSTVERHLPELEKAQLITKNLRLLRDPKDNTIIASELSIGPGLALRLNPKEATVPDQKPSGGPRPKCAHCGGENVKQKVVHTCLDCGHISGLDVEADAVSYADGASYTPPPELVVALQKPRINTPKPQFEVSAHGDDQLSDSGPAPVSVEARPRPQIQATGELLIKSPVSEVSGGSAPRGGPATDAAASQSEDTQTTKNPHEYTGTSHWEPGDPPPMRSMATPQWNISKQGFFPNRARDTLEASA